MKLRRFGGDDPLGHANMGFVGGGVFFCEGIGEIGIEEKEAALPFEEKAALT